MTEQIIDTGSYTVVPRTLIFLLRGNEVLLIRGSRQKTRYAERYNGLGGHVEMGEDVLSAARRELLEEAGIEDAALFFAGTLIVDTGASPGVCLFVFGGEARGGALRPSREGEPSWVPIDRLRDFPVVEDLFEVIPRVAAVAGGQPPFMGRITSAGDGHPEVVFTV